MSLLAPDKNENRITLIVDVGENMEPGFSPWARGDDGQWGRVAAIPEEMTMADAERIAAERVTQ